MRKDTLHQVFDLTMLFSLERANLSQEIDIKNDVDTNCNGNCCILIVPIYFLWISDNFRNIPDRKYPLSDEKGGCPFR